MSKNTVASSQVLNIMHNTLVDKKKPNIWGSDYL